MTEILDTPTIPAQTEAPATEPTGWMSPDGEFRNGTPDGIQALLDKKQWTNVGQLADAYGDLEKFKGMGEHLVIPEAEDAEGWNDIYNKMGRPETSDAYELKYEGDIALDDDLTSSFKQFAHGLGLTQKQFNDIVGFQLDAIAAQETAFGTQLDTTKAENVELLKQKYGIQYDAKMTSARATADSLGIYETLNSKGLASDPDIINMLATIASKSGEDILTPASPAPASKSPQEELAEIQKNPAFLDKFSPNRKELMKRYMELNTVIANSGGQRSNR